MFDFIKRAQLHRQGLSCGRKRRKNLQSGFKDALRSNPLVGLIIFAVACVLTEIMLKVFAAHLGSQADTFSGIFVAAVFMIAALHWYQGLPSGNRTNGLASLTFTVALVHLFVVGLALVYGHRRWHSPYALLVAPHAFGPMVVCMLAGRRIGLFSCVYVTLLGATLVADADNLNFVATSLSVGFMAVFASQKIRRRSQLLMTGLYVGLVATIFLLMLGLGSIKTAPDQALLLFMPLFIGVMTTMLAGALLPVFEQIFHVTTDISWLELSDLNHPLMKRLSMEAPGTYHHSLVVANLSEAAAESIGANATMCRVCSYFHDIGKLTKPEYFIENMDPEDNPHDDLTARMSALILMAHVKDGVDLAIKHGLNSKIISVIEQHHGSSLVWYFYRRALDQKKEAIRLVEQDKAREDDVPEVSEDSFRYPGPRPEFKESAIISLADAVESASRTLAKPTPSRVEQLVDDIVRNRILDHQLDECDLTLSELAEIKASFVRTLSSMMHSRIKYPKEPTEREKSREEKSTEESTPQPEVQPVTTSTPKPQAAAKIVPWPG